MEITVAVPQEAGNRSTSRSSTLLLGIYPKDASSYYRDTRSTMFISALFIIVRNWKQLRCSSMEEWIKKMWWYLYMMECYLAVKQLNSQVNGRC